MMLSATPKITIITSLFNCSKFIEGYLNYALKTQKIEEVEFLLLHNQATKEELNLITPYLHRFPNIKHILIPERESLYATWNRGVKMAAAPYITIWNVDDIRTPESVWLQAVALDETPNAMLTYGDFYGTNDYRMQVDRQYEYPQWVTNKSVFLQRHMIGCFPMWRREIHERIGYFDENYRLVADFEFQLRVALNFPLIKSKGNLGYYLENQPHKLSSQQNTQHLERTSVEWRYRLYGTLDLALLKAAKSAYDTDNVISFGKKTPITELVPAYLDHLQKQWSIAPFSLFYTAKEYSKRTIKQFLGVKSMNEWPVYQRLNRLVPVRL